jgi:4-methyl-5(b-hydroxyethyl)-thiazole monophosphate biosynthesis
MSKTNKRALIILFNGFEEIEALTAIDLLSRAKVDVTQAAIGEQCMVTGRSGITIKANCLLDSVIEKDFDALIFPGGPGINALHMDKQLLPLLRKYYGTKQILACICAAPLLLLDAGILPGPAYTCHPAVNSELSDSRDATVVVDGNLITSQGAGNAIQFALAIIQELSSYSVANSIAESICFEA